MIRKLEKNLRTRKNLEYHPDQQGYVPLALVDIQKARALFDYELKTPFADVLVNFYNWLNFRATSPNGQVAM